MPTHRQRAVWTFLLYTLVAPFFGALVVAAMLIVAPLMGLKSPLAGDAPLGVAAAAAFVWSAVPAAAAGLMLVPVMLKRGTFGWIEAAGTGVVAFAAASALFPFAHGGLLPYLAFLAGLVSLALRAVLIAAGIITR